MSEAEKPLSLRERLRQNAKAQGIQLEPLPGEAPAAELFDDDLIPEVQLQARSDDDVAVDGLLDRMTVLDAYNRWTGKGTVDADGKRESIMIRCPRPDHEDRTPSAWINLDKGTWFCGGCNEGGDKFDIAGWHFGLPVPGYKSGKMFPELRRKMAGDLGYVVKTTPGGTEYVERMPVDRSSAADLQAPINLEPEPGRNPAELQPEPLAPVIQMPGPGTGEVEDTSGFIDWRAIVPDGTFLREWMETVSLTDMPDEYLFWNGMAAVNFAAGRDVTLLDTTPVIPNLFFCLFGASGTGKSRSITPLVNLLREALPYEHSNPGNTGVRLTSPSASAESLVDSFNRDIEDPNDPDSSLLFPVRGLVQYAELSDFVGRAARQGNTLKPTLMAFYDGGHEVATRSRGHGDIRAVEPFCQAITTTQVKSASELLRGADADSGFLNRWVFVTCTPKPRVALGGAPIDVTPLVTPLQTLRSWASRRRSLRLTPEALERFQAWFDDEYIPTVSGEDEEVLLQRCDLLMKKLMVTFAVDRMSDEITLSIVEDVLALWPYLQHGYGIVRRRLGVVETTEVGDYIIEALKEFEAAGGRPPTVRDLYARKLRRRVKDKDVILRALTQMKALGEIEELTVIHPGNKTVTIRYRLVKDGL